MSDQMLATYAIATGEKQVNWMLSAADERDGGAKFSQQVDSPEALAQSLEGLERQGELPAGLTVNVVHSPLREAYLARHPENADGKIPNPAGAWHMVLVMGINKDASGKVESVTMHNPWGTVQTVPIEQMYQAMLPPPEAQS